MKSKSILFLENVEKYINDCLKLVEGEEDLRIKESKSYNMRRLLQYADLYIQGIKEEEEE